MSWADDNGLDGYDVYPEDESHVHIDFIAIQKETDKAFLIEIQHNFFWFPKSQVEIDEEEGQVTMPTWLWEAKLKEQKK